MRSVPPFHLPLPAEQCSAEDDSPYPEVRSAVANTDDPDMACGTFRAWFIGIIWAILIPGLNQFFFFRYPSVTITGLVAQLLSFPMGRAWARFLPNVKIFGLELNPGPFTVKECVPSRSLSCCADSSYRHVLVQIMASVGAGSAYAVRISCHDGSFGCNLTSVTDGYRGCPACHCT